MTRGRRRRRDPDVTPEYALKDPRRHAARLALFPRRDGFCRVCDDVVVPGRNGRTRCWHDGRKGEPNCLLRYKCLTSPARLKAILAKKRGARCAQCGAERKVEELRRLQELRELDKSLATPRRRSRRGRRRKTVRGHEWLILDHVLPLVDQGSWDENNLQLLCPDCHKRKTSHENVDRAARRRADRALAIAEEAA